MIGCSVKSKSNYRHIGILAGHAYYILDVFEISKPRGKIDIKQDEKTNSKGFGFCEYNNVEIAASALRNLDKIDYKGRQLRIGPPDKNSGDMLSEEENLMKKDITFIKESNAIIDENGKNQNNDIKKKL